MPRTDIGSPGLTETVLASAARTVSGNSGIRGGYGAATRLRAQLDVTAIAGTSPTLDVVIEDTLDGTNFYTVGTFVQKIATGREAINVTAMFSEQVRYRWTIGGTGGPSFTFSVTEYSE